MCIVALLLTLYFVSGSIQCVEFITHEFYLLQLDDSDGDQKVYSTALDSIQTVIDIEDFFATVIDAVKRRGTRQDLLPPVIDATTEPAVARQIRTAGVLRQVKLDSVHE